MNTPKRFAKAIDDNAIYTTLSPTIVKSCDNNVEMQSVILVDSQWLLDLSSSWGNRQYGQKDKFTLYLILMNYFDEMINACVYN